MSLPLTSQLEALLFWKAEPVSHRKLCELLSCDEASLREGITALKNSLSGRGITIIESDTEVTLGTSPEAASLIEQLTKDELSKDLGKAGLETLSIILYQGPLSRADIDYIRGVSSQFILRNLLIRGLVEKVENPKDQRSFLYKVSLELLSHLGISRIDELPDREVIRADIETFKTQNDADKA